MPLHVTVVPASTQAGQRTIATLLSDSSATSVTAIYRTPSKAPAEFVNHPNFQAIQGDVSSDADLDFTSTDVVFYVPPPTYDGTDTTEFATRAAGNVKAALRKASKVKRLLILSAMGAQHEKDIGILAINHVTDEILKNGAPEVVIVRPGYFMESWASAFETMKGETPYFESFITPLEHEIVMISLRDIAKTCAHYLLQTGTPLPASPHVLNLHGPRSYSAKQVQAALETATGTKPDIVAIQPGQLTDYFGQHIPLQYAKELAEMTRSCLPNGILDEEMRKVHGGNVVRGTVELVDVLRELWTGGEARVRSGAL